MTSWSYDWGRAGGGVHRVHTHIMEEQLPAAGHTGGEEVTRRTPALK